jgi:hypothetical protein
MTERRAAKPWDLIDPTKKKVSKEIAEERMEICKGCPRLIQATKQCKECGCIMVLKTKLASAFCPIGKWEAIETEEVK